MSTHTESPQLPPLALYIHIPWCIRKCPYCDFNSHEKPRSELPVQPYVDALIADMENDLSMAQGRGISSIFIGGGTPSLMPNKAIANILEKVDNIIGVEENAEITMEANPGTVEHHDFAELLNTGVNRLSLGVQSFDSQQLEKLGRIHSADEATRAVKRAQDAGFEKLNIDLMHGLPGQSLEQAMHDLVKAIALEPRHLSWYQLTIEQNTEFFSRPPKLPEEETLVDIYEAGHAELRKARYSQYEVSAYAKDGNVAKHNLNYWTFGDYMAIGAGAHGKITDSQSGQIFRYHKTRMPDNYLDKDKPFTTAKKVIDRENLPLEFMMNALRLTRGFSYKLYPERTGLRMEELMPTLKKLEHKGLLALEADRISPTSLGRMFLNTILEAFL